MTARLGILGLDSMGRYHIRNTRATGGVELVMFVDLASDRFGIAFPLEVLPGVEDPIAAGVDMVIVTVSTAFYKEAVLPLAEAGVHTLVGKSLSMSVESGRRVAEAFERADLIGAVGYVERCNPALVEVRHRIAQDQLGEVYQIVTRRRSPFPAHVSNVGIVKDLATYDVDLASQVVGAPYEMVFAQVGYRLGRMYEDLLLVSGHFTNGVLVSHQVNWLTPYKDHTAIVIGEHGALAAGTAVGDPSFYENGSSPLQRKQTAAFRGVPEGTATRYALDKCEFLIVEHEHFGDAILGWGGECVSMAEGVRTLEVLESIFESARTGQVIRFSK